MPLQIAPLGIHPAGEVIDGRRAAAQAVLAAPLPVDTHGRPSHVYHSCFVRGLRLVLDVEVRPGKQHSATHSRDNLWRLWESLPREYRPWLLCGE